MYNQVIAHIEIEDHKIEYYSSVVLRQHFNAHHEFEIRIRYDVLEKQGSFSMDNAQKLIGKSTIIKLFQVDISEDPAYEFRGIICEIIMEQSEDFTRNLVLKGYSLTILLENGSSLASFYKADLKKIVKKVTKSLSQNNCNVNLNPQHTKEIKYICQYKESAFHFLNRLSSDYSEWFYYDGKDLNFGKPSSLPNIDITYGEDVNNIQFKLRLLPMTFSNYSYISKDDKLLSTDAPPGVDGLGQYASYVLQESNKVFSDPVNLPLFQRVENKSDLDGFVKKQKAAMAADLEVLTGTSHNPLICVGAIANVHVAKKQDFGFTKEEYGKFLITGVTHHIEGNDKYHNTFEGIPATLEVVPVKNIILPIAEPQIGTVKDNKDPDNMGKVKVQMLWQKDNETTDFLRVMTPDAGGGKDGAKNRGLVVIPEPGDQVLVCFRDNHPDHPFIMGSMFHGKSGGGGGQGNNTKSLNSKSGHTISLDDGAGITIVDKTGGNKIVVDGTNTITITSSLKIVLTNGTSSLTMDAGKIILTSGGSTLTMDGTATTLDAATVDIIGSSVNIEGTADAALHSGETQFSTNAGGDAGMSGKKSTVSGTDEVTVTGAKATINGSSEATVTSSSSTSIQGAIVKLN